MSVAIIFLATERRVLNLRGKIAELGVLTFYIFDLVLSQHFRYLQCVKIALSSRFCIPMRSKHHVVRHSPRFL